MHATISRAEVHSVTEIQFVMFHPQRPSSDHARKRELGPGSYHTMTPRAPPALGAPLFAHFHSSFLLEVYKELLLLAYYKILIQ